MNFSINKRSRRGLGALAYLVLARLIPGFRRGAGSEDPDIVRGWAGFSDVRNSLYRHISQQAYDMLDKRERAVVEIEGAEAWAARRLRVRETLAELVGPFPERTPLRPRITGTIRRPGFRVEKLIFESQPGFPVTAAVFVPENLAGRAPAIVFCCGHSHNGFRYHTYQPELMNLARKGYVVLAFDPVGQGERLQYPDRIRGGSKVGNSMKEHSYPGAQMILTGDTLARVMIWDGMRAVDYLLTRPDVDATRIGITGRSGGGAQAAYIAAFDDRIAAAASGNWICSYRRIFETIAPQDAEQNIGASIARGLDQADLLTARAPGDTLIVATTRDFFSIQGVYDTVGDARPAFAALGRPDALQLAEDDAGHIATETTRDALYRFFDKSLGHDGGAADEPVTNFRDADLKVTRTGQVVGEGGVETLFTLNRARAQRLAARREEMRETIQEDASGDGAAYRAATLQAAMRLSGYAPPGPPGPVTFVGRNRRDGYTYEKYYVAGEGDYVVPFVLMLPPGEGPFPVVIALHPDGRMAALRKGGAMEALVRQGYAVASPDLIGTGETGPGTYRGDAYNFRQGIGDYNVWFGAMLIGRSFVGIRAGDVVRLAQYLRGNPKIDAGRIAAVAHGRMGPVLLHAAAFEPAIARVALVGALATYDSIVMNEYYKPELIHSTVPGALTAYDLPDLAATLAPRPLLIAGPVDHRERPADLDAVRRDYAVATRAYAVAGADAGLRITRGGDGKEIETLLA